MKHVKSYRWLPHLAGHLRDDLILSRWKMAVDIVISGTVCYRDMLHSFLIFLDPLRLFRIARQTTTGWNSDMLSGILLVPSWTCCTSMIQYVVAAVRALTVIFRFFHPMWDQNKNHLYTRLLDGRLCTALPHFRSK